MTALSEARHPPGEVPKPPALWQTPEVSVRSADKATLEYLEQTSRELEHRTPEEILAWAVEKYYPRFTMATGLGPEGCVIISMLAKIDPRVYVFNLDTGYQFPETLELRDRIAEKYGMEIDLQKPGLSPQEYEKLHGGPVYETNSNRCCYDRKIAVLHRVAVGYDAWATGVRRDQSPTRGGHADREMGQEIRPREGQPVGRLDEKRTFGSGFLRRACRTIRCTTRGYPSIGCQPCTRPVSAGEDERAGRWSGSAKTECGLHT